MNASPSTVLTLLLLSLLTCLSSCASDYRVYIHERDLHSYYKGTEDLATVEGHYIDIIRCGEDYVLPDGSLQLSSSLKVFDTSSCSGRPLDPTGNPLPPIPHDITAVTINWHADNTMVEYSLDVDAHPEDHFEMIGVSISRAGFIPQLLSEFQLKFDCHPSSVGLGQLNVNLTTLSHSTTGKKKELTSTFHFDKICKEKEFDSHQDSILRRAAGDEGSGGGIDLEPSVTSIFPSTPSSSSLTPPTTSETPPLTSESSPSDMIFMPFTSSIPVEPVSSSASPQVSSQPPSPSPSLAESTSTVPALSPSPSLIQSTIVSSPLPESSSPVVDVTTATTTVDVDASLLPTTTTIVAMTTTSPQETSTFAFPSPSLPTAPSSSMMVATSPSSSIPLSSSDVVSPSLSLPLSPSSPSPSPFLSSTMVAPPLSMIPPPPVLSSTLLPSGSPGARGNGTNPEVESKLGQLLIIAFAPVVAVLVLAICILICCICCCACKRRKKEPRRVFSDDPLDLPVSRYSREIREHELEESFSKAVGPPLTEWMSLQWGTVSSLPASIQSIIKRYTVDRRSLSIISTAKREECGAIVRGQWSDPAGGDKGVLMKMLTGFEKQYGHRDEIVHFVDLATLLCGRDHPNVHKVLKVSVEDNYVPLVIYPLAEYGNLHQFLTFCRTTPSESPLKPDTSHKMNFALQILSAMTYLSNEGIVHSDLALRNCLLDTGYSVKVSDGALSQLFFPDCYCNVKGSVRPARWAAIETLRQGHLTSLSNVWSYGVTVWEIMTLGEMPYSDINDRSVVSNLMMGQRLPKPDNCLDTMYEVMQRCWQEEPANRPTFDVLYPQVSAIDGKDAAFPTFGSSHSIPAVTISRQSTPTSRNNTAVQPIPQYVPVVPSGEGEDERVPDRQNSSLSIESRPTKRDSLQPDKLSITFSVLSGDLLSEGGGSSSSESEEEEEQDPELLEADLIDKFMPSLRRDQPSGSSGDEPTRKISTDELLTPTSTLTSTSGGGIKLEDTLKYSRLPSTALSPGPFSTSTLTSRLSPCETHSCSSSQYGPSTTRSDETPVPGVSSPSPDLTSKASTVGDETMSIASNQLLAGPYHYPAHGGGTGGGEAVSKTSTLDSTYSAAALPSTATMLPSTANAYPLQSNHVYSQHLNGGSGMTEYGTTNGRSPLTNGHPPVKANGDVIKTPQSSHSDTLGVASETALNGVVLREGASDRLTSRESATSRTSFGLGLGDLSSDLMSAFDSWKT